MNLPRVPVFPGSMSVANIAGKKSHHHSLGSAKRLPFQQRTTRLKLPYNSMQRAQTCRGNLEPRVLAFLSAQGVLLASTTMQPSITLAKSSFSGRRRLKGRLLPEHRRSAHFWPGLVICVQPRIHGHCPPSGF